MSTIPPKLRDVPGRSVSALFHHETGTGQIRISYQDLRRSTLRNSLEAQEFIVQDLAAGAPPNAVFASKCIRGGPREPVWIYEVTTSK